MVNKIDKSSTNDASFSNFFDLFEQPIDFNIDTQELNSKLRQLQKQHHPDKIGSDKSIKSQQNSAIINHAYNILRHPDSRANYLLELSGKELNTNDTIADLDFLDDAMDMRVNLDDATSNSNLDNIKQIGDKVDKRINEFSAKFDSAYHSKDWINAFDATQKLKFLVKLKKDVDTAVDEAHQIDNSDDDLYL